PCRASTRKSTRPWKAPNSSRIGRRPPVVTAAPRPTVKQRAAPSNQKSKGTTMSHQTLELSIDSYFAQVAKLNGVASAVRKFSVVPAVQQTMEKRIQQSSAFLSAINVIGVNEMQGEKVGLGVSKRITSNTDTSGGGTRTAQSVHDLDKNNYLCRKNNFDTALRYATMDAWVGQPNFQELLRDAILEAQALDRICIGFNG